VSGSNPKGTYQAILTYDFALPALLVIPAKAGIQSRGSITYTWFPACAGMTTYSPSELVRHALFGEPHRRATGTGAEEDAVVPLSHIFGE
jgi:hypothetical protein